MQMSDDQARLYTGDLDDRQKRLDKVLRRGLFFGFFWLGGIGSVIALISGLRARRIMDSSGGELSGNMRSWACILAGMAGLSVWLVVLFLVLVDRP